MITGIAWKNVWRNKSRSLIVIAAVTVGVFAGVFAIAIMNSAIVQRIDASVNEELSHIQINNKDFRNSTDLNSIVKDREGIISAMQTVPGMKETTARIIVRGIASTSAKSTGVEISGIDVQKEKEMFTLSGKLIPGTGSFLESDTKFNNVFIGEKLARELNIIRFIIDEHAIARLREAKVPENVIDRLQPLSDKRFTSDKKFSRAVEEILDASEIRKYALSIKESAWSYRNGSRIILTFLDVNNIQTGAAFRVSGIFRTNNDMFESFSVFVPE